MEREELKKMLLQKLHNGTLNKLGKHILDTWDKEPNYKIVDLKAVLR